MSLGQACQLQDGACCPDAAGRQAFCSPSTRRCVPCVVFKNSFEACSSEGPCCTLPGQAPLQCGDGICLPQLSSPS